MMKRKRENFGLVLMKVKCKFTLIELLVMAAC